MGLNSQHRRLFAMFNSFDIGRPERLEIASYVLNREISSFNDLTPKEVARMVDAMLGATYVTSVLWERHKKQRR